MKSLLLLLQSVLTDCETLCGTTTTRDFLTISRRVEAEGLSFLTITLGDFCQDFERGLEEGIIDSASFRSFRKLGRIPLLFVGITSQVFDSNGRLLDQPSLVAVSCIRQICRMWKKIELPCKEERNQAAFDGYVKIEDELSILSDRYSSNSVSIPYTLCFQWDKTDKYLSDFLTVSGIIWSKIFGRLNTKIADHDLLPRHGTGAVALKCASNQKYIWREWHQRLEDIFPISHYGYTNYNAFLEDSQEVVILSPEQERPVRVVSVPKTLKAPRIIAIEPTCMQYTQQALCREIMDELENNTLTKGHINFRDQSINAKLALESSLSRLNATIDLKDASDRVHSGLVNAMLSSIPLLRDAIFACRSQMATLPDGKTIHLEKFASMGSALCFPIESMVFYTILIQSEIQRLNLPLTARSVNIVSQNVFVYGDDLVVPVDSVPTVTYLLEAFGLKVNTHKSFSKGNFRESCGTDAYLGVDVTPSYIRRLLPSNRRDVSCYVSAVELSNQLHSKFFFNSTRFIETHLTKLGFRTPYVADNASCVGYKRFDKTPTVHRYNRELHRPEVKAFVVVAKVRRDEIDGHAALMKWHLQGLNPDRYHYKHSVGSGNLALKTRWCTV